MKAFRIQRQTTIGLIEEATLMTCRRYGIEGIERQTTTVEC